MHPRARGALVLSAFVASAALSACSRESGDVTDLNLAHPTVTVESSPTPGSTPGSGGPFPFPPGCDAGWEDECFTFRLLAEDEAFALRTGARTMQDLFAVHRADVVSGLDSDDPASPFFGIHEEGLEVVFATIAAYELAQYRDRESFAVPAGADRESLLADGVGLVCNEYVTLAIELFYELDPQSPGDPVQLQMVGWRRDSLVGNHAQLFATGTGVPLLIDPTFGFVARGSLAALLLGERFVSASPSLSRRFQHGNTQRRLENIFEQNSVPAGFQLEASDGTLRPGLLIYTVVASDVAQGGLVATYASGDFIRELAPGPGDSFHAVTTAGALQRLTRAGIEIVATSGWRSAVGRRDDATALLADDGTVTLETAAGSNVLATNVSLLASSPGRTSVYALRSDGDVLDLAADGITTMATGMASIGEGRSGSSVYLLADDGTLSERTGSGTAVVGTGRTTLLRGRGAQGAGRSAFTLAGDGTLVRLTSNGSVVTLAGPGASALDADIADFRVGVGGFRVTILTGDGRVLQGELTPDAGVATWVEPFWFDGAPTAPFVSIDLILNECLVLATQEDGGTRFAASSSF